MCQMARLLLQIYHVTRTGLISDCQKLTLLALGNCRPGKVQAPAWNASIGGQLQVAIRLDTVVLPSHRRTVPLDNNPWIAWERVRAPE